MRVIEKCIPMDSRRNDVWHCQCDGRDIIRKCFATQADYLQEKCVYRHLLQVSPHLCPDVIDFDDLNKEIIWAYIPGVTVLEALEKAEEEMDSERAIEIFTRLLDWMQAFYKEEKIKNHQGIRGDINLRNFIWTGQHIFGIDFEGYCLGDPIDEIHQMIAFYFLYKPEKTRFKLSVIDAVMDAVLQMTNRSLLFFWESVEEEMERILVRRKMEKR